MPIALQGPPWWIFFPKSFKNILVYPKPTQIYVLWHLKQEKSVVGRRELKPCFLCKISSVIISNDDTLRCKHTIPVFSTGEAKFKYVIHLPIHIFSNLCLRLVRGYKTKKLECQSSPVSCPVCTQNNKIKKATIMVTGWILCCQWRQLVKACQFQV